MGKVSPKSAKKAIKNLAKGMEAEMTQKGQEIADYSMAKGFRVKDALRLNDTLVEGLYGQAYRLYNTGKYDDAIQIFRLLIRLILPYPLQKLIPT